MNGDGASFCEMGTLDAGVPGGLRIAIVAGKKRGRVMGPGLVEPLVGR